MCGIAGYWFKNRAPEAAQQWLRDGLASLHHRGPDDRGAWFETGVGMGHTRLSILDLSPLGHQPMASRNGRWMMVFNGEVYNFREIRKDLELLGHTFLGTGDSEVILEAFSEWGPGAVRRFVGMFAIALWSKADRRLYLVRDRVGVKPLYYGWNASSLWFGSELKALRAFKHWSPQLDRSAMVDFFRYGYIAEPRSIYQDVFKLPPGHWLEVAPDGEKKLEPYWSVLDAALNQRQGSEDELAEELEALMIDAFRYRMISDVPVGVFLSGGIDSSSVAAILQHHAGQRIKTYTIGFDDAAFDESPHAERVARHLGTDHTTRILKVKDAMRILPQWGNLYDEPFGDRSGIPTLLVSQIASESVKVVLSADGGDELFSGYNGYTHMFAQRRKRAAIPEWLGAATVAALRALPVDQLDGQLAAQRWPAQLNHRLRRRVTMPCAKIRDRLQTRTMGEMFDQALAVWSYDELRRLLGWDGHPVRSNCDIYAGEDGEKLCLWDLHHYLPANILTKVDRATMAVSIEGREPLLDHRLVEFAFALPFRFRRSTGGPKHLLRKVLYKYVPREYLDRPKQGFDVPLGQWLAKDLALLIDQYLESSLIAAQGIFDTEVVRRLLARFRAGDVARALDESCGRHTAARPVTQASRGRLCLRRLSSSPSTPRAMISGQDRADRGKLPPATRRTFPVSNRSASGSVSSRFISRTTRW
jgi:asparagine synthase (glutamine-hydrolysing)